MALCAGGNAPNITAFLSHESVAFVSGQCGVPQWPSTTKLSRSFDEQRGHAVWPDFLIELRCALWVSPPSITAFGLPALSCWSVRAAGLRPAQLLGSYIASASQVSASALERRYGRSRLACASSGRAIAALGFAASSGIVDTRPLRPPASLLHNAALPSVPASRCAKAPLGAGHRFAPYRVKATGVMQSGLRWRRSHSRRRSPFAFAPYAPPSARPCGVPAPWHQSGAARCVLGQWPAASHVVCAPTRPWASPLRGLATR
jgi:hypothetical protein